MTSTEIVLYGDPLQQARGFINFSPTERRLHAVQACADKNFAILWEIVQVYIILYGESTVLTSQHSLRSYKTGIKQFVEYAKENAINLMDPGEEHPRLYFAHLKSTPALNPHWKEGDDRKRKAGKLSSATLYSRLAAVRLLYRALRWTKATDKTPFSDARVTKDRRTGIDKNAPYTLEEVDLVLQHTSEGPLRVLVFLLAHGGLRIAEALAVTREDVGLRTKTLQVKQGKGGTPRKVRMSASLVEALDVHLRNRTADLEATLFDFATRKQAHKHMARVFLKAGVDFRGFHAFRKHAGTTLLKKSTLQEVQKHLGHRDPKTTLLYAEVDSHQINSALDSM